MLHCKKCGQKKAEIYSGYYEEETGKKEIIIDCVNPLCQESCYLDNDGGYKMRKPIKETTEVEDWRKSIDMSEEESKMWDDAEQREINEIKLNTEAVRKLLKQAQQQARDEVIDTLTEDIMRICGRYHDNGMFETEAVSNDILDSLKAQRNKLNKESEVKNENK